ncbi:hypothetical protein [Frondihabitans sucicola]|nr:hypothetical protein [Frondihabitans sucicola]
MSLGPVTFPNGLPAARLGLGTWLMGRILPAATPSSTPCGPASTPG